MKLKHCGCHQRNCRVWAIRTGRPAFAYSHNTRCQRYQLWLHSVPRTRWTDGHHRHGLKNFPERKREIATLDRELTGMLFAMMKLEEFVSLSKATFFIDHQAITGIIRMFDGGLLNGRRT